MVKISRNDLCACGSGKKYKKCCGKNKVVSLDSLIVNDLYDIQFELFRYSIRNYQDEIEGFLENSYEDYDIPEDAMEMFNFFAMTWVITSIEFGDKTIFEMYIDQHLHKYSRQRMKDILQSWKNCRPSVFTIQDQNEERILTLRDLFTNETHEVIVIDEEDHEVETGGIVLGTVLPAGPRSIFFTTFISLPASNSRNVTSAIKDLYNGRVEDPAYFMEYSFLDILNLFFFETTNITVNDLEWESEKHEEVAESFKNRMEKFEHNPTSISLGLYLWNKFCEERNPTIKKTVVYEAALVYLVEQLIPFGNTSTQKELSEEYGISSSSISSKYRELDDVLVEEIEEFLEVLNSDEPNFDDLYGEDIYDEEDFDDLHGEDIYGEGDFDYTEFAEELELLQLKVEVEKQKLGEEFFKQNKGHFWGIFETRPYMEAKCNYAELLHESGYLDVAIEQYEEILELNEMDNLGVRYELFIAYVENNSLAKAAQLLRRFDEIFTTTGSYNQLLIEFLQDGSTQKAFKLLKKSKENNRIVIDYLLEIKELPSFAPDTYEFGSESEAIIYAGQHIHLWQANRELMEWLELMK